MELKKEDEIYFGDYSSSDSLFKIPVKKPPRRSSEIVNSKKKSENEVEPKRSSVEIKREESPSLTNISLNSIFVQEENNYSPRSDNSVLSGGFKEYIHQKFLQRSGAINIDQSNTTNQKFDHQHLKIAICTFNVAEAFSDTIGPWIASHQADIYAIGLQEIDMSARAFVKKSEVIKDWDEHFKKSFDFQHFKNYKKIISEQFVGMYHCIYIHKDHYDHISNGLWSKIGLGVLGFGNKGCIAFRFNLYEKYSFCFINAHFVSSKSKINERNQNHDDILVDDLFSHENQEFPPLDHDFLFFYGDLNYRSNLSREEISKPLNEGNIKYLLESDQLSIEKEKKNIFVGFEEGKIDFLPTFKFNKNSSKFDTSKKLRVPSYCDRILVKSKQGGNFEIEKYVSKRDEYTSDHRPVLSLIRIDLKK